MREEFIRSLKISRRDGRAGGVSEDILFGGIMVGLASSPLAAIVELELFSYFPSWVAVPSVIAWLGLCMLPSYLSRHKLPGLSEVLKSSLPQCSEERALKELGQVLYNASKNMEMESEKFALYWNNFLEQIANIHLEGNHDSLKVRIGSEQAWIHNVLMNSCVDKSYAIYRREYENRKALPKAPLPDPVLKLKKEALEYINSLYVGESLDKETFSSLLGKILLSDNKDEVQGILTEIEGIIDFSLASPRQSSRSRMNV